MSKIKITLVSSLLSLGAILFPALLLNVSAQPGNAQPAESVVVVPEKSKKEFLEDNGLKSRDLQKVPALKDTYVVSEPTGQLEAGQDDVTVAPRRKYKALLTPNDPIYPQYYSNKISAPAAWDISTGSSDVKVAVIDTGFGLDHEDLAGRWDTNNGEIGSTLAEGPAPNCTSQLLALDKNCNNLDDDGNGRIDDWRGWDFAHNDNNPNAGSTNPTGSGVSHGTSTAGLVGATGNNNKGIASVNWGSRILPLQMLDDNGSGYTEDLVAAINYAAARQVKVINLSLGSAGNDPLVEQAITNAVNAGIIVVASAGNCGDSSYALQGCSYQGQILYPAKYNNTIAVGATDANDARAAFSSYGPEIDLVAPGSGAISTPVWTAGNTTTSYSSTAYGTSFSTPIVAGTAATAKGLNPNLSPAQMRLLLTNQADKVAAMNGQPFTAEYGFGRLNSLKTLQFSNTAQNVSLSPVYRLNHNGRYLFTTSITEVVNAVSKYGFVYEGISFYASTSDNSELSPVYRLNRGGSYLFTTSAAERDQAVASYGFTYEGVAFYASTTITSGTSPTYRLRLGNNYLFTTSAAERDQAVTSYGYVSEGTGFYTPTAALTNVAVVFRLNRGGKYLYTQSADELVSAVTKYGFIFENEAFYTSNSASNELSPVFRLNRGGNYLFTTSTAERDQAVASYGYMSEGTAFYASAITANGFLPVYRLNRGGNYLFTISTTERDKAISSYGYMSEGTAFYAYAYLN